VSRVSVVIPCHNYAAELRMCLDSVLSQQGVDLDVLVIDDFSSDASAGVAADYAARDSRVQWRRHAANQGHILTYNEGLGWARGDYTVLISADDVLAPGALRRAAAVLDAHPEVGFVYGHVVRFVDSQPRPASQVRPPRVHIWEGEDWVWRRFRDGHNVISSPEVMVRTALQRKVGGYRVDLPHSGDLEMWLRLASYAKVAYLRGVDQAYYRVHARSMARRKYGAALSDLTQRWTAFDVAASQGGRPAAAQARLRQAAGRAIAREALASASRAFDRGRTSDTPVTELVNLARVACPEAQRLPAYVGLRARMLLGERVCASTRIFGVPALFRRARRWIWWRHWAHTGV
jgi:hypothetical protein